MITVGSIVRITENLNFPLIPVPAGATGEVIPPSPRWNMPANHLAIDTCIDGERQICVVRSELVEVVEQKRMKALTVRQPYAQFICDRAKRFETRPMPTNYRGSLIIHAGKSTEHFDLCEQPVFKRALRTDASALPLGAALCIVDLVDCVPVESLKLSSRERAFGDYTPGRFAYRLENIRSFDQPIPVEAGQLGLWFWQ